MIKKKILVVEDDNIASSYLNLLLIQEGYEVVGVVNNGIDAIEVAKEYCPDLILMDIMLLGRMTGAEAAVEIHYVNPEIKMIFLTGFSGRDILEYAIDADVTAYLMKPYREEEILSTITLLFAHKKEKNHLSEVEKENIVLENGYRFNIKNHRLFKGKKEVHLGKKLLKLIEILATNKNVSVSNEQICTYIWGESKNDKTLRSLVHRIRVLLNPNMIENVNGLGYKMN